ncbi:glycine cleavage system protein GcvH [Haliangium sp.]|uniref:glycine cleavage system protein GcvH n=1 Tax=Haliangium sp. TaxID=2663208 RepID=UPI003D13ECB8
MSYPKDLKYTEEHEWVRVQGNNAVIGITEFAAEQLGDVVAVELPEEGDELKAGESCGSVESVKAVADLFAPISGKVIKVNTPLNDSPEYVNEDPYDEGWMIEVEMSAPDQLDELMDVGAYTAFVADTSD